MSRSKRKRKRKNPHPCDMLRLAVERLNRAFSDRGLEDEDRMLLMQKHGVHPEGFVVIAEICDKGFSLYQCGQRHGLSGGGMLSYVKDLVKELDLAYVSL